MTLTAAQVFDVLAQGRDVPLPERGLLLLRHARGGPSTGDEGELPWGDLQRELLAFRGGLFGSEIELQMQCPNCGEELEVGLTVEQLSIAREPGLDGVFEYEGQPVGYRLPRIDDMRAARSADPQEARQALLQRCLIQRGDAHDEAFWAALGERLAAHDPLVDLRFGLDCAACAHQWSAGFDIVRLMWMELGMLQLELQRQVHLLATVYGWSERDILELPEERREVYVRFIQEDTLIAQGESESGS